MPRVDGGLQRERMVPRLTSVMVAVVLVVAPVAFHRGTFTVFDQVQRTVLFLGGIAILSCLVLDGWSGTSFRRVSPALVGSVCSFVLALLGTWLVADDRWAAWTGLEARGMGASAYLVLMAVFVACWSLGGDRSLVVVLRSVVVAHVVVVGHGLIQVAGWDPMDWDHGMAIGGRVLSTLGNPNFGAAFVGFTLPVMFWAAYRSDVRRLVGPLSLLTVVFSSSAVGAMGSIQGQVLVVLATACPLWEATRYTGRGRVEALVLACPMVAVMILSSSTSPSVVVLVGGLGLVAISLVVRHLRGPGWPRAARSAAVAEEVVVPETGTRDARSIRVRVSVIGVGVFLVGGVVLVGPRLLERFTGHFVQRAEFWSVGWDLFLRDPLLGHGLESFGDWFTRLRSFDHAVAYETFLTDSLHSVPLSLLTGGGIILFIPYLALVVLTGGSAVRRWRTDPEWESRLITGTLGLMWLGYLIQGLVSVDVPSLALYGWVAAGLLVARGGRSVTPAGPSWRYRLPLGGVVLLAAVVLLVGPVLAPLRADAAAHRGQVAFSNADFNAALAEVERAASLQPRNGFYTETLGRIHLHRGNGDAALLALEHSAMARPGNPGIARLTGRVAQEHGYHEMASHWYGQAVTTDPHAPEVLAEAARFYAWWDNPQSAYRLLDDYHRTDSANPEARNFSLEALLLLGDVPNGRRGE